MPAFFSQLDYVAIPSFQVEYNLLATKRYPKFSVRDFLLENDRFWIPVLDEGKKINYVDAMAEYIDFDICHYPLAKINNLEDYEEVRELRGSFIAEYIGASREKVIFVDHHTCHAHHAYFSSPLRGEDVLVLTMDGFGDGCNATVHTVDEEGRLKCQYQTNQCRVGTIYQFITMLLGMKPAEHEFKVMGLAAYAKEKYFSEVVGIFQETYYVDGLEFKSRIPIGNHYEYFKKRLEGYRFDAIAGGLQRYVEGLVVEWIQNWLRHTRKKRIVFSGGGVVKY
jgi:carbamoyltransferase